MGRHHARVMSNLVGVELVAVDSSRRHPSGPQMRFVPELDEVLREGIDLAVVAVPTALHETVAVRLAESGVHALVEKPVAADVAASERMADAFESAGLVGCVGHIERYNPAVRELRRRIGR